MRRSLQIFLAALSLVTLVYGVAGLATGVSPYIPDAPPALLDNQFRYSAGVYLVFSFLLWWIIPEIERHAVPIRIIAGAIMLGGVGRLISIVTLGAEHPVQLVLMAMELGAPILILWQGFVARTLHSR